MIREQAKEEMYQHLLSDYELTRAEAKDTFEMTIIDKIYTDFKLELETEYKRGQDSILNRTCEGCKWNYEIENRDEDGNRLHSISPNSCYVCSRNTSDKWEQK